MGIKEEISEIYVIVANEPAGEAYASTWTVAAYNNKNVAEVSYKVLEILLEELNDLLLSKYQEWEMDEAVDRILAIDPQFPGLNEDCVCLVSYDLHTTKFVENVTMH